MAENVNVGVLEAQLKLVDLFTAPMKEISRKLDKITDSIEADLHRTDRAVNQIGSSFSNLGREVAGNLARYFTATALVAGGVAVLTSVTKQLVTANLEAEASEKKVEEAVRRHGASSGVTVSQIDDLAQAMSRLSGLDDEAIADAEALSLKFNRISTDTLPRFTQAALDLSVATGMDLPSAFEKAGKIVNQPLKGLTLLGREGYAVSKSQSDMVKKLSASNDILGAQAVMLDILEGQYGGAAKAARDTMGGAITALGTTWENFLERVGQDNMGPLRQALEDIIDLLETATDSVYDFELGWHKIWASVYSDLAIGYEKLSKFTDLLAKAAKLAGQDTFAAVATKLSVSYAAEADAAIESGVSHGMALAKILMEGGNAHKRAAAGALEQTEAESKLGDEIRKLQDSINQAIEELQRKADNSLNLWLAAKIGVKEYSAELLKQKVSAAILQEENKLRETGGKLTENQRDAIESAILWEDHYNQKLKETIKLNEALVRVALTVTDNISRIGFSKDFESQLNKVHEGMSRIKKDVDEMLNALNLDKELNLDIDFASRLNSVDPSLRAAEERYLQFLERMGAGFEEAGETALDAGERIFTKMGERWNMTVDGIKKKLQTLSDINLAIDLKADLAIPDTPNKKLQELQKTLKRLQSTTDDTGEALLTAAEAEEIYRRAISEGLRDFASSVIGIVQLFSELSGGTNKWGKALSGLSGVVSSGGYNIAAWAELFIGLAEGGTNKGGVHAGAEFNLGAGGAGLSDSWTMVKGQLKEIQKQALEIANAINLTVLSLGGIITDLPAIELVQKGQGWVVNIEGEIRRYFDDWNEAIAYATSKAIANSQIYNIDDEVLKAFSSLDFSSLEEIRAFTDYAREYTNYGTSELTQGLRTLTEWLLESSQKAIQFGLSIAKVGEEFGRRAQSWRDQILGIVRTPEEKIHQDVQDFNAWVEQQKLSAQIQIDAARAQMDAAQIQMAAAWTQIKALGKDVDPEVRALFLESQRLFKEAGVRLDLWTKALENLPPAITPEEEEAAKKRKKGGGGNNVKGDIKDWIKDRKSDLDSRGLDSYQKSVLEKEREYQDKLNELGKKDKGLRAELVALRERELSLMAEERRAAVSKDYQGFIDQGNAFKEIRDTASSLIDSINDSPFGDAEKAGMISDILTEVNDQIEELSLQTASDLFGSLLQDMEKYGASEADMADARKHLAFIEHTLKVAHYRAEFEILKANGTLSQEILAALGKAIDFVAGADPLKFMDDRSSSFSSDFSREVDNTASELEKLRESFKSAKDKILETVQEFDRGEFGAVTPESSWEAAKKQFLDVVSSAQKGSLESLQKAPEAFKNALDVLKDFSPALYASESFVLRNQLESLGNLKTIKQGNLVITDFEKREQHREVVNTLNNGFQALTVISGEQASTLTSILTEQQLATAANQELKTRLIRLESGTFGKREI